MRKKVTAEPNKVNVRIKEDMKVSLGIEHNDGKSRKTISLSSIIEEVLDDGCLVVHMPMYKRNYYPLEIDSTFLMHFFVGSRMYATPVQYEGRFRNGNFVYAKLRRLGGIENSQRRHCYRLPCSLPVTIERHAANENHQPDEENAANCGEGQMIDFSDGGMLFATNENIERGEKISLSFDIGTVETVEAVTLRVERTMGEEYRYKAAVQFHRMEKTQKNRLYKYIADAQREMRKRQVEDAY